MKNIRVSILVTTAVLLAIGAVMIYSSSGIYAHETFNDSLFFLKRHVLFLGTGLLFALGILAIDYRSLQRFSKPLMLASLILLILVLFPRFGSEAGGARRWFRLWGFSFQPSELVKLTLIIYLSDILSRKAALVNNLLYGFLPPLFITGVTTGLILLQPDLGTAVAIGIISFVLFFAAGVDWKYLAGIIGLSLPVITLLIVKAPYRMRRMLVFFNPWKDPRGSGFQIIQSFLALGLGGVFGVGLGMSKQKLFYLPASHTDFIFSIIGEELGLIGTTSVVLLFMVLIWQAMRVAFKTENSFGRYLSLGIASMIAIEAIVNIGVSTGALPTKGLPLPFISYGGTALVFHIAAVALLLNVAKER